jgi:polysaccharide export outer membrane protein
MKTGERWSSWKARAACWLLALPALLHAPGCAKDRVAIEKNLMAQAPAQPKEGVLEGYRVGCPDVIELVVGQRPEFSGRYEIGADGRIELGDYGRLLVEGRTLAEIAQAIVAESGASAESVAVHVAEFRSQHLLLFGEVLGSQRSVSYRGQETVLELLQRVGGITAGAEPRDVYVVRPHLGEAKRPEVFHVDLSAIVLKSDHRTNVRLLPFDQVYVGETRRAQIEKAIPAWLRLPFEAVREPKPPAPPKKAEDA